MHMDFLLKQLKFYLVRSELATRGILLKGALRNFAKFTGKYLCQSLFFNKVAGLSLQLY